MDILNSLTDVNFELVDVSRELVTEGKIIKISARNGEKSERYLYLVRKEWFIATLIVSGSCSTVTGRLARLLRTSLLVQEVCSSIPGPVKSDAKSPTARLRCGVSSKLCWSGA